MKKYFIKDNSTIAESMQALVDNGSKCLLVINNKEKLIGTLTDGDIRRSILKKKKLSSSIKNIYNKKPKYLLDTNYKISSAKKIFLKYLIDLIPIIDKDYKVVKVIRLNDVLKSENKNKEHINLPVVVMAGGKGSRLEPFTNILPKPLIPVNHKPIIEHIFDKFAEYGIKNFYASINFKSKILKAFFQEVVPFYNVEILEEKKPLGTVGSLSKLKGKVTGDFFLTNCDILINEDYAEMYKFHVKKKYAITVVAAVKKYSIPYGDCKIDANGRFIKIQEKPEIELLANTGFYIMNKKVLKNIPLDTYMDANELLSRCKELDLKVGLYPISEKNWIDVGEWEEYRKTASLFTTNEN